MPCRSRRASIGWRPRFNRSALARSIPEKWFKPGIRPGSPVRPFSTATGGAEPGAGKTGAARPRNGVTLRVTSRHSSLSPGTDTELFAFAITYVSAVVDQNDMEPPGPVCTELDALLDIAGARRAGDEVNRTRQPATGSQPIPAILIGGDDLIRTHDDDMGVGQKIQRCRGLGLGDQHQGAGLRYRSEARRQAD